MSRRHALRCDNSQVTEEKKTVEQEHKKVEEVKDGAAKKASVFLIVPNHHIFTRVPGRRLKQRRKQPKRSRRKPRQLYSRRKHSRRTRIRKNSMLQSLLPRHRR